MEIAARDFKTALQTLRRLGLLSEVDAHLPSVASLIAGEPVSVSWCSHASAQEIFTPLGKFADHRDVMFTKLISGKVTLVHRTLWLEIFSIGTARAPWQMKDSSKSARKLLKWSIKRLAQNGSTCLAQVRDSETGRSYARAGKEDSDS